MNGISFKSKLGYLTIFSDKKAIIGLSFKNYSLKSKDPMLLKTKKEVLEYLDKKRTNFTIPIKIIASTFCKKVCHELLKIKYGKIVSYKDLSLKLKSHPRAIGVGCKNNPIPIIVPCHRVVAINGKLTGYSGGLGILTKDFLLKLEGGKNVYK